MQTNNCQWIHSGKSILKGPVSISTLPPFSVNPCVVCIYFKPAYWVLVLGLLAVYMYLLPKRTNSRKLLFISISCISIIFVYILSNISINWWYVENRNIRNFGFYIELFHPLKHFKRSSFIFTSIPSQSYEKIAAMSNSTEWHYEIDTCSVSHGKSHGSCNVKYYFRWMRHLCVF